ncbi:PREDICTED: uncharacterized protein LOC108663040 [Theobroma cacao]|uniref:Uncharacterized protein LOC108663040 n=1 Tax=Theobroma cacao TaxID=3641 RepID=A0AB32WQJ7_THECC|nr:PREDICTED: uncharacterized protein LOC108663040 [Theobroma cacao]
MVKENNYNGNNAINLVPEANRALQDYAIPLLQGLHRSIRRPSINANKFEIKPAYIQMIQSSVQFGKLPNDDPNSHLVNFLEIYDAFKYNRVTDNAIRLRLFSFSLRDKAKSWLNSLPNGSITTLEDLGQKFLAKFFSPTKIAKMRNDITSFIQFDVGLIKITIDVAVVGALMSKNAADAYNLLEEMASIIINGLQKGPSNPNLNMPPGIQRQARPPIPEKKSQTQVGQLANSINNKPQGALPSDTQVNPKGNEHCNAVTLRSGKEVEGVNEKSIEYSKKHIYDEKVIVEKEVEVEKTDNGQVKNRGNSQANYLPPSFPQRLKKQKLDKQFKKFLNVFKKLHINIPFAKVLENMPSYVKFLKDILTKKRKLEDFEIVALTEECSAIIQNKLPPKLKDLGSFSIPCTINRFKFTKALWDLGAGVSIMPLSIAEKLGLNEIRPTIVSLQLADKTIRYLVGIIEDVLVKVGHLYILVDFIVLEMEEDLEIPLILGRPFLATAGVIIDVREGKITFKVGEEVIGFEKSKKKKIKKAETKCFSIAAFKGIVVALDKPRKVERLSTAALKPKV